MRRTVSACVPRVCIGEVGEKGVSLWNTRTRKT